MIYSEFVSPAGEKRP